MDSKSSARDAYQSGDLTSALSLAVSAVKENPSDETSRIFLAEVCCVVGDLERADKQLQTLLTLSPELAITASNWRQLIRAAYSRKSVYEEGETPTLIGPATPAIELALSQLIALRGNDEQTLQASTQTTAELELSTGLTINGEKLELQRDLDDINAQVFEFLGSNGKYFWVDFSQIERIEFSAPERPLDLLWRKCSISTKAGSDGVVFMPTIYPTTSDDPLQLMGRQTAWQTHSGLELGNGLREFLVGEEAVSILDIKLIERA